MAPHWTPWTQSCLLECGAGMLGDVKGQPGETGKVLSSFPGTGKFKAGKQMLQSGLGADHRQGDKYTEHQSKTARSLFQLS